MIEPLRRSAQVELDPHILHAGFVFDTVGRRALSQLHRTYIEIAAAYDLPIVVGTPTWRASPERTRRSTNRPCSEINEEAARYLLAVRSSFGSFAEKVWIAGLMGCKEDAYNPKQSLSVSEAATYHEEQICALSRAGVDFLLAATLPAAKEAHGMALAMSKHNLPYVLSFVLRSSGTMLDGTPLHEVIDTIDAAVHPRPLCYWANCVHPSVFTNAVRHEASQSGHLTGRLIGLQANTSPLPPEDLDGRASLQTEDPSTFAVSMLQVHESFGTKVLGGCCGTEPTHIHCLAEEVQRRKEASHESR
jgi:homocysteine S-methyltransferase